MRYGCHRDVVATVFMNLFNVVFIFVPFSISV